MLAARAEDGLVQIGDISAQQCVPRKFLELILLDLKKAGLVDSLRGRAGGYRLARVADDISFGEVIRLLDGPLAIVPCASATAYAPCSDCTDEAACAIRRAAILAREEMARVLDNFTLAEAAKSETNAIARL